MFQRTLTTGWGNYYANQHSRLDSRETVLYFDLKIVIIRLAWTTWRTTEHTHFKDVNLMTWLSTRVPHGPAFRVEYKLHVSTELE